ncbi:alpha/beta hydrolase (plasmid) [Sinorhizobium meliloti]|nr:alpha/beta hydrolase [Sinorhizobium meliloti]
MTAQDLYRIRDFVPDFDTIAAEFAERSWALSARADVRADIRYGSGVREVIDLILPERVQAGAPLHVFVHGGYWRSGEKINYRFVAAPVLAAGGIAALVEYDLMPRKRLDVLVDQVRRSVLWLQAHAGGFRRGSCATDRQRSFGRRASCFLPCRDRARGSLPALPCRRFKACCS